VLNNQNKKPPETPARTRQSVGAILSSPVFTETLSLSLFESKCNIARNAQCSFVLNDQNEERKMALRAMLHLDSNKLNDKVSVKTDPEKMAPTDWRVQGSQEVFLFWLLSTNELKRAECFEECTPFRQN